MSKCAQASLTSARQARAKLTLGGVARRHNARAQHTAVMTVLQLIHEQMFTLEAGLREGRAVASPNAKRFVDAFKGTQMWLQTPEEGGASPR